MKIYIFGGEGFIGKNLVEYFSKSYGRKNIISIDKIGSPDFKIDLARDIKRIISLDFSSSDVFIHLAANPLVPSKNFQEHFYNNVITTYNLLQAMLRKEAFPLFVYTSTSAVYGNNPKAKESTLPNPISYYGATKLASEYLLKGFYEENGGRYLILRLANIIGKHLNKGVIFDFVKKLRENPQELKIKGNGKQKRSYLDVEDVASFILLFLKKESRTKYFEIYNLGNLDSVSVMEVAKIVAEEMSLSPNIVPENQEIGWKGDVKEIVMDISKAIELGWKPSLTSEETIRKTVRYLLKEKILE